MDERDNPSNGDDEDDYIDRLIPGRRARFEEMIERVRRRKGSPPRDPTKRPEIHPVEDDDNGDDGDGDDGDDGDDGYDGQGPASE